MPRRKASDSSETQDNSNSVVTPRATRVPRTPRATIGDTGATPVRRPGRPRRTISDDSAQETATIVDAVLRSRGSTGATPELLASVISWAREVREEGDVLTELGSRPRRRKTAPAPERIARYEMDRALLDGVLKGTVLLDVQEGGQLLFKSASLVSASIASESAPSESSPVELTELVTSEAH